MDDQRYGTASTSVMFKLNVFSFQKRGPDRCKALQNHNYLGKAGEVTYTPSLSAQKLGINQ